MENSSLLSAIQACTECQQELPHGCRPVLTIPSTATIAIIGQAPGKKVHETGIPWNDASGKQLRKWMGITDEVFYHSPKIAIVPMGFCYPGKGKSGDLPPQKQCAPLWHNQIWEHLPNIKTKILIGKYAQDYYLPNNGFGTLTENVRQFRQFAPEIFPLPHPSPRNRFWLTKNPWFEQETLVAFQEYLASYELDKV